MNKAYRKPELRTRDLSFDKALCLSEVPNLGGTTTDYEVDNENLNG